MKNAIGLAVLSAMLAFEALAVIDDVGAKFTGPGVWTTDMAGAKAYAKQNDAFFLIAYGRQGGGCGNCNVAAGIYNDPEFKNWAKENKVALICADVDGLTPAGGSNATWVKGTYNSDGKNWNSLPILVLVHPDGVSSLGLCGAKASMPLKRYEVGTTDGTAPLGVWSAPFEPPTLVAWIDFCLAAANNQVNENAKSLKYKRMNEVAREVFADEPGAEPLKVNGIWKDYGVNYLVSSNHWIGSKIKSYHSDLNDWFKFTAKAGASYKIDTPYLEDPNGMLTLCAYSSLEEAQAVSNYESAVSLACFTATSAKIANGVTFTPAAAGTVYFQFTIREPQLFHDNPYRENYKTDWHEEYYVKYTFTLQEADNVRYWFSQQMHLGCEEGSTNEITVVRSSSVGAATAKFVLAGKDEMTDVTAFEPGDYAAAEEGADFYFIDADGKVVTDYVIPFADGETRGTIRMVVPRGPEEVQTPDRAFGIRLDGAVGTDAGQYGGAVVVIDDKDKVIVETEGPQNAVGDLTTVECKLYDKDTEDVYTLTNLQQSAGSVYTFSVDTIGASDFADGKIKVEVTRDGKTLNPDAFSQDNYDSANRTMRANKSGYVFYIWGSDSEQGGDVTVKVSRAAGAVGECPNVKYQIQYRRFDRPVVSFAAAADAFMPADLPTQTNVALTATGLGAIKDLHKPFEIDVAWKTADPESGAAAVANDDYVPVASSNCTFTAESGVIALELLRHDGFSSSERSFVAELAQPPENSLYVLGAVSSHAFTFVAGDAPAAATEADPLQLAVSPGGAGQSVYLASGERNLSATNRADWIRYAVANTNGFFLLQATNVTMRPAAVDAKVLVYTNGVHDAALATYALADLVDSARCLSFAGVTNKVIDVCVTRDGSDDVFLTYELLFKEWQVAEGGELDEADPVDDVRGGAFEIAVDADGSKTNAVRTLHGCGIAGYTNGLGQAVNDCADWFKFTGICAGERYIFTASAVTADVPVTVSVYLGDAAEPTNQMTLAEFADSGWLYDAQTAEDVVVSLTREAGPDRIARVAYTLAAAKYVWPVVGFEKTAVEVTNDVASVTLRVVCTGNLGVEVPANVFVRNLGGRTGYESRIYGRITPAELTFTTEKPACEVTVPLNLPKPGEWTGDWKFEAYAEVDPELYRLADGASNVVVTVVDAVRQKDPTDPVDDDRSGATEVVPGAATSTNLVGHLNGIDAGRDGAYADKADWFRFTGLAANSTYRFTLAGFTTNDCAAVAEVAFRAEFVVGGVPTVLTFAELAEGYDVNLPAAGDIEVRLYRDGCDMELPISAGYDLEVERIAWPVVTLGAASLTVTNDAESAVLSVNRTGAWERQFFVDVVVTDTNRDAVASGGSQRSSYAIPVDFTKGSLAIPLVRPAAGFWRRGGDFTVSLEKAASSPCVVLGNPSNLTVRVVDKGSTQTLENDYPADDTFDGAQAYGFGKDFQSATNYYDAAQPPDGRSTVWLNGGDTNDWYRFTGTTAGHTYRFEVRGYAATNVAPENVTMTVYAAAGGVPGEELASSSLRGVDRLDVKAQDGNGFFVKVARPYDEARDVSVRYAIGYREMSPNYVKFAAGAVTVSEAADAVYVDVVCITENNEKLENEAGMVVVPTFDEEADNPAWPDFDYDPTPQVVTWDAETTGGVKRVRIGLCNYDSVWEGDETFKLVLTNEYAGTAFETEAGSPHTATVTIVDKDELVYGTVGITDHGDLTVREGGVFPLTLTRVDGCAGVVTGRFTWTVAKVKTVQDIELFADRKDGVKVLSLNVPKSTVFALSQTADLAFELVAEKKTVAITKGTDTKFKLTLMAENYGGPVGDFAKGDPTQPAFRTSGTSWYAGVTEGTLVASTPKAGASSVLTTTVTGPGTLQFDAMLIDCDETCALSVRAGGETLRTLTASEKDVSVHIDAIGSKQVQFVFSLAKGSKATTASAAIGNIRFVRDEAANLYGTFTGAANVGGVPGTATLTVSAKGKVSGKFVCADRTWSFTATGGWSGEGKIAATAKAAGCVSVAFELSVDRPSGVVTASATDGSLLEAVMLRSVWAEKPLATEAVRALEDHVGYHTVALPQVVSGIGGEFGSGYLTMTVGNSGAVKASGKLADGQSVSLSGTLGITGDGTVRAFLFAKPAAYKGGWFFTVIDFGMAGPEGCSVVSAGACEALSEIPNWVSRAVKAPFERRPLVSGGWYDKTENLYGHYSRLAVSGKGVGGEEVLAEVSFSESGSKIGVDDYDGMLTISYVRATGVFSGIVRRYEERESRMIRRSSPYRGVLTPNTLDFFGAGRGFFEVDGESKDLVIRERGED